MMPMWSVRELSDIFNVAISTVHGWVSRGKLHATKITCREGSRVRTDDLMDFLKDRPTYKHIFMEKLTKQAFIGEKWSKTIHDYLLKEGYLE